MDDSRTGRHALYLLGGVFAVYGLLTIPPLLSTGPQTKFYETRTGAEFLNDMTRTTRNQRSELASLRWDICTTADAFRELLSNEETAFTQNAYKKYSAQCRALTAAKLFSISEDQANGMKPWGKPQIYTSSILRPVDRTEYRSMGGGLYIDRERCGYVRGLTADSRMTTTRCEKWQAPS